MKLKILLTGATGFVGKNIYQQLKDKYDFYLVIRDKRFYKALPNQNVIIHDFCNPFSLKKFPLNINVIIHLAQSRRYKNFPDGATDIFNVNIKSTFDLLEYARLTGVKQFIYFSSGGIYKQEADIFMETDEILPIDFYFSSKYSSELFVANYKKLFNTIILRPFFIYGKSQKNMIIPRLIDSIKNGKAITLTKKPDGIRMNPIHIDDLVGIIVKCFTFKHNEVFNVAGSDSYTIKYICDLIGEILNKKVKYKKQYNSSAADCVGNIDKMRNLLNYTPHIAFEDGVKNTIC